MARRVAGAQTGRGPHVSRARRVEREHVALQADLVGLVLAATRTRRHRLKRDEILVLVLVSNMSV